MSIISTVTLQPLVGASVSGGASASTVRPLTAASTVVLGVVYNATFSNTLSGYSLSARFGHVAKISAPTARLTVSGTSTVVGRATLSAPSARLTATGNMTGTSTFQRTLSAPTLRAYFGAVSKVSGPGYGLSASGTQWGQGRASLTLPLYRLSASGTMSALNKAILTGPSFIPVPSGTLRATASGYSLTAIGNAVVTVDYEAYAMNMLQPLDPTMSQTDAKVNAITHYSYYPFDYIVRWQGHYYGVSSAGMFLLEGTTDNGSPINYSWKTCTTDFEDTHLKTVVAAYFGGRLGTAETVTLYAGESNPQPYNYSNVRGAGAKNYRQKFGRGLKERYYALGVAGQGAMTIDKVTFEINTLTRSI